MLRWNTFSLHCWQEYWSSIQHFGNEWLLVEYIIAIAPIVYYPTQWGYHITDVCSFFYIITLSSILAICSWSHRQVPFDILMLISRFCSREFLNVQSWREIAAVYPNGVYGSIYITLVYLHRLRFIIIIAAWFFVSWYHICESDALYCSHIIAVFILLPSSLHSSRYWACLPCPIL